MAQGIACQTEEDGVSGVADKSVHAPLGCPHFTMGMNGSLSSHLHTPHP
jgi:hypothetical protein